MLPPYNSHEPVACGLAGRKLRAVGDDVYDVMAGPVADASPATGVVDSDGRYRGGFVRQLPPVVPRDAG